MKDKVLDMIDELEQLAEMRAVAENARINRDALNHVDFYDEAIEFAYAVDLAIETFVDALMAKRMSIWKELE